MFVNLAADVLESALRPGAVQHGFVTANERLKRELNHALTRHAQTSGLHCWRQPRVQTLREFKVECFASLVSKEPDQPGIADALTLNLLMLRHAPQGAQWTVDLALDAFEKCAAYRIDVDADAFVTTANARSFAAWHRSVRADLKALDLITEADVAARLVERVDQAREHLHLLGFEHLPPADLAWLNALGRAGYQITRHRPVPVHGSCQSIGFDHFAHEIRAAAQWARAQLAADPHATVGVVVPDLQAQRHTIRSAFAAEFAGLTAASAYTWFDVSGGDRLSDHPVWQNAARLLKLCVDRITSDDLNRLIRSNEVDLGIRHLASDLPQLLTIDILASHAAGPTIPRLRQIAGRRVNTLAQWAGLFAELLANAGWTGRSMTSGAYQAYVQIKRVIDLVRQNVSSSQSSGAGGPKFSSQQMSGRAALMDLQRLLANSIFAPAVTRAPIQILGYLETNSLKFDHLW
ncbi:MAG: hypothetical protein O3A63_21530, partial [Proteobacteria bacterium]|nr:hypothetical protein [Pseudomonadota bacterium]